MVKRTVEHWKPKIGMMSLVGIGGTDYPLSFGNYFSLSCPDPDSWYGLYIVNMWAENFKEWFRRHPADTVEVTVLTNDAGFQVGFITDDRVDKSWLNDKMCVTGHGWGSRELCEAAHDFFGTDAGSSICGCEAPDQAPSMSKRFSFNNPITTYHCMNCDRVWEVNRG